MCIRDSALAIWPPPPDKRFDFPIAMAKSSAQAAPWSLTTPGARNCCSKPVSYTHLRAHETSAHL
eukprot:11478951-Alexandrium_andersonii.AAC.1